MSDRGDALHAIASLLELPSAIAALRAEVSALRARLDAGAGPTPAALVDVAEAARTVGVAEVTIRRWVRSGEVHSIRRGRVVRVDLASLRGRALTDQDVADAAFAARAGTRKRTPDCASDRGDRP